MWQPQNQNQNENYNEYQEHDVLTQKQLIQAYQSFQDDVRQKFKQINTDALEQIKKNMKRKQTRISQQQNITLIMQERGKIIIEMKDHVAKCWNPHCKQVKQIVLRYGFSKNMNLDDTVSYICKPFIPGLCHENSECYYAEKLNQKMFDTHRLIRGI